MPNGAKEHTFKFLASYAMAPTAHLIVYYVKDDGELVADSLDIDLNGELRNFVSKYYNLKLIPHHFWSGNT